MRPQVKEMRALVKGMGTKRTTCLEYENTVKEMRAPVKEMRTKRTTCLEYENTCQGNESSGEGDENKENNLSRI